MPVLRSGTFVLYGITLANPDTLTDGATLSPPDPGSYYLTNLGFVPTSIPCAPQWSPPTVLDTTTEGTGLPAAPPPPGFVPRFLSAVIGPVANMGLFGASQAAALSGLNVGNHWSMAGSLNVALPAITKTIFPGTYAGLLTDFLALHIVDLHAGLIQMPVWPTSGGISSATVGPRITGSYDIVAFWWTIRGPVRVATTEPITLSGLQTIEGVDVPAGDPVTVAVLAGDRVLVLHQAIGADNGVYVVADGAWTRALDAISACGDRQDSHLQLAAEDPGAPWEALDPLDDDAAPVPVITRITPDHGILAGGTAIVIEGAGFGDGCTVAIDGVPCTSLVVDSQFRLHCLTPAHAAGLETVVVTNPDGATS